MRQVVMHGTALVVAVTAGACSADDAEQPTDRSGSPTGQASPARTPTAVSYTHLTLPTICSV